MTEHLGTEGRILDMIGDMPFLTRGELVVLCGLTDGEARHGLRSLLQKGLLDRTGHARRKVVRTQRWYLTRSGIVELARRRGNDRRAGAR